MLARCYRAATTNRAGNMCNMCYGHCTELSQYGGGYNILRLIGPNCDLGWDFSEWCENAFYQIKIILYILKYTDLLLNFI